MTWQGVATSVVALAAFCTALGVLSRLKPVKWLWRKNIVDPLSGWLGATVDDRLEHKLRPIRYQLETNDGSSIKDAIGRLEKGQTTLLEAHTSSDKALAIHIEKFHPSKETNP